MALEHELRGVRKEVDSKQKEIERLLQRIKTLKNENKRLCADLKHGRIAETDPSRTSTMQDSSADQALDNERLRKLVRQLERALADSYPRLRKPAREIGSGKSLDLDAHENVGER